LRDRCEQHLISISFSGQDSLNRELLTSDWSFALEDPKVILALFAIEELNSRSPENQYRYPSIQFETILQKEEKVQRSIASCIEHGLKDQHPIVLEKLPLNIPSEGTLSYLSGMQEYVKRSDAANHLSPVLQSITLAYGQLGFNPLSLPPRESKFDQPYSPEKWANEYRKLADQVLGDIQKIQKIDEKKLFAIMAKKYTPEELRKQVQDKLSTLLEQENVKTKEMTKEELVKLVSGSVMLLDPEISHGFYDPIHFMAALTCVEPPHTIETKEGILTIKELFIGIMDDLKKRVNEDNAIAAEQFYIRLLMIDEKIGKIKYSQT
jgi:hypothetical protein